MKLFRSISIVFISMLLACEVVPEAKTPDMKNINSTPEYVQRDGDPSSYCDLPEQSHRRKKCLREVSEYVAQLKSKHEQDKQALSAKQSTPNMYQVMECDD